MRFGGFKLAFINGLLAGYNVFIGKFNSSKGLCASNESHTVANIFDLGMFLNIFVYQFIKHCAYTTFMNLCDYYMREVVWPGADDLIRILLYHNLPPFGNHILQRGMAQTRVRRAMLSVSTIKSHMHTKA
jgi:hypothetical protein